MRLVSDFHAEQFAYLVFETLKELIESLKQDEFKSRLHIMLINSFRRAVASSGRAPRWHGDKPNIIDVEDFHHLQWEAHKIIDKYKSIINDHQNPYIIEHAKEQLEGCEKALREVHDAFQSMKMFDFFFTDPTYERFRNEHDLMKVRSESYDWLTNPDQDARLRAEIKTSFGALQDNK